MLNKMQDDCVDQSEVLSYMTTFLRNTAHKFCSYNNGMLQQTFPIFMLQLRGSKAKRLQLQ